MFLLYSALVQGLEERLNFRTTIEDGQDVHGAETGEHLGKSETELGGAYIFAWRTRECLSPIGKSAWWEIVVGWRGAQDDYNVLVLAMFVRCETGAQQHFTNEYVHLSTK